MNLRKLDQEFFLPNQSFFTQTIGYINTIYHSHTFFEIFYVHAGQAYHNINGKCEIVKMGDILFLRPGDLHAFSFCNSKDFLHTDILFDRNLFEKTSNFLENPIMQSFLLKKSPFKAQLSAEQCSYFESCIQNINSTQNEENKKSLILSFLTSLLSLIIAHNTEKQNIKYPLWLNQLISLLNVGNELKNVKETINGMLENLHYNRSYISRTFSKYTGMTMTEYLNKIRFSAAYALISSTNMSIEYIIDYVGLSSKAYFYREFEKRYHTTPKKLRKV